MKRFWLVVLLFLTYYGLSAQEKYPSTLLWRISGKGLQQSYLYGTMHLQDRRLFYFGDSVYHAIEKSEGFATEIHMHEMMDSIFSDLQKSDTTANIKEVLSKKEYERYAKKLEKKLGIPVSKITVKKLTDEKNRLAYSVKKPDDMITSVDPYLWGIAERLGKWVGGIEDVQDQLSIKDELGNDFDVKNLFIGKDTLQKGLEWMINVYVKQDINAISKYYIDISPDDITMIQRNKKMSERIDSLGQLRSMFFAVGAAHLPGEKGLIKLLRKKGFTVEPVFSSKKLAPEDYSYPEDHRIWTLTSKEEYKIEMPGKPVEVKMNGQENQMLMYADVVTNSYYLASALPVYDGRNPDTVMMAMAKGMSSKGTIKKKTRIKQGDISGWEILISAKEDIPLRIQLFQYDNTIHFAVFGAQRADQLENATATRFFQSFQIKEREISKSNSLFPVNDTMQAFSALLPAKPKMEKMGADSTTISNRYMAVDNANGIFYQIIVTSMAKGYFLSTSDSVYFNLLLANYRANPDITITDSASTVVEGLPSYIIKLDIKQDGYASPLKNKVLVIKRGNRIYSMVATFTKETELKTDAFFRSFRLLENEKKGWQIYNSEDLSFSAFLPEKLVLKNDDPGSKLYFSYDKYSGNSFFVSKETISKYYSAESDSAFWTKKIKAIKNESDSVFEIKFVTNKTAKGIEYITAIAGSSLVQKNRLLTNGDTLYHIFSILDERELKNPVVEKFYNDFSFGSRSKPGYLNNKTAALLADLNSKDSATLQEARAALRELEFSKKDLPLLMDAVLKPYSVSDNDYLNVNEALIAIIGKTCNNDCLPFLKDKFKSIPDSLKNMKLSWISAVATIKTEPAFALVKELLLSGNTIKEGYTYSFIPALRDSLELTRKLYPEILKLTKDPFLGMPIIYLATTLLDSSLIRKSDIAAYEHDIFRLTDQRLKQLLADKDDTNIYDEDLILLLEKMGNSQCIGYITKFSELKINFLKKQAILALFRLNQNVAAEKLQQVAADKTLRFEFYSDLEALKKEKYFPAVYKTQPAFAESRLLSYAQSEGDASDVGIESLGERIITYKGQKKRVFLFKIKFDYEESVETYLGISGTYSLNKASISTDDELTGIYWKRSFSKYKIDADLKDYIKSLDEK